MSLALAFAPLVGEPDTVVARRLAEDPAGLARSMRATGRERLLFIDQLEELITQAARDEAEIVAEGLHVLVVAQAARLIATARTDFLTRLAMLRGLGDDLAASLSLLRPLSEQRLFEVVVEPAATMGSRSNRSRWSSSLSPRHALPTAASLCFSSPSASSGTLAISCGS